MHETLALSWWLVRLNPRSRPSTKRWTRNEPYRVYRNPFHFQFTAVSALSGVVRTPTDTMQRITAKEALTYVWEGNLCHSERQVKNGSKTVVCTLTTTFGSRRYMCHANVTAQYLLRQAQISEVFTQMNSETNACSDVILHFNYKNIYTQLDFTFRYEDAYTANIHECSEDYCWLIAYV